VRSFLTPTVCAPHRSVHRKEATVSTTTEQVPTATSGFAPVGDAELWYEQRGEGPDVLLIAGLTDPAEAWEPQLAGLSDRYRLTAFDNRGAGRSPAMPDDFTVERTADDAAALLRTLGIERAHIAGFSGGSATAQHLALRHPDLVRSLILQSTWGRADVYFRAATNTWKWLVTAAPDERAMLEAFFLYIYTARAHNDGTVAQIIDEALAFPYPQSAEQFLRQLEVWTSHDELDRLHLIAAPTLVLAGGRDVVTHTELGRAVAERIPGAAFRVLEDEAHQPFQERPEEWNALVREFWSAVD
jgi:pimeloyl-ACP methyl ester carboxylesterase